QALDAGLWARRPDHVDPFGFSASLRDCAKPSDAVCVRPCSHERNLRIWDDHFHWSEDGAHVVGITPTGRATVAQMQLNYPLAVTVRKNWVDAGWPLAGRPSPLVQSGQCLLRVG